MRATQWISLLLPFVAASEAVDTSSTQFNRRQVPKHPTDVKTIKTANNATIRYKEPGKKGVCETTPGVKSYSGYVDTSPTSHTFFWFFEARHDPENAPITLWLNGGPGSDSLFGLFQELGPCGISEELESYLNPYSWNEVSNVLFLSQPVGVGFSYADKDVGSLNILTKDFMNASEANVTGRFPVINATEINTTKLAAKAAWEILQGFFGGLSKFDTEVKSRSFNLWTESYGGHWGPAFFEHFYEENEKISKGAIKGTKLEFNTLGIINGLIDQGIQSNASVDFALNNTYGIQTVPKEIHKFMKLANEMKVVGCQDLVTMCKYTRRSGVVDWSLCSQAATTCKNLVQRPLEVYSDRDYYDIRGGEATKPPVYFKEYLNTPSVMDAIGVDVNYTSESSEVRSAFELTGDMVFPDFLEDIEKLLSLPVRVALVYGDADYLCNWFGGEAISLAVNYTHSKQFSAAGYAPFVVNGKEYGATREYGNFSFTRVYDAGHMVPFNQPAASLQLFNRTLHGLDLATGKHKLRPNLGSHGPSSATHTQASTKITSSTSLPSKSGSAKRW